MSECKAKFRVMARSVSPETAEDSELLAQLWKDKSVQEQHCWGAGSPQLTLRCTLQPGQQGMGTQGGVQLTARLMHAVVETMKRLLPSTPLKQTMKSGLHELTMPCTKHLLTSLRLFLST